MEIETLNRCNGVCPFCPVNVNEPQREYARMTDELFKKIIDEFAEMGYERKLSLYSNNEPFLDNRIISFYRYARSKLPSAFLELYTNGSLLTFEMFLEIVNYLDSMIIDNYNDKREINTEELRKIYACLEARPALRERVKFSFRLQNEVLTSRGGQAPNKRGIQNGRMIKKICHLPYRQLVIRPTGKVSLCCNDALGKYTMGDLTKQSIREVWNSEEYNRVRGEMLRNGRKNLPLCRECDNQPC